MTQNRTLRNVLIAVICVIVFGAGVMLLRRVFAPDPGEAAAAASVAAPKPDVPAMTPPAPAVTPPTMSDAAADAAREASWREAREATFRMQQRLRREHRARQSAEQEGMKNERCVDGQRMKRVENGWVQAGNC